MGGRRACLAVRGRSTSGPVNFCRTAHGQVARRCNPEGGYRPGRSRTGRQASGHSRGAIARWAIVAR